MKKSFVIQAVLIFLFLAGGTARAATFTVTKTADTNDGVCNADCSLREAVAAASNSPDASDVIEFSAFFDVQRWIVLNWQSSPGIYEPISLTKTLEIRGKGSNRTAVDGGGSAALFEIHTPFGSPVPNVVFRDLQFTNATGAISNEDGNLTIESCLFLENYLEGSKFGGAALHHHSGNLVVVNSTFDGNVNPDSGGAGGAISLYLGTATITDSTFVGNAATRGGAFYSEFGTASFINSTICYNSGLSTPEASYVVTTTAGTINLTNATVMQNRIRSNGSAVGRQWTGGQNA